VPLPIHSKLHKRLNARVAAAAASLLMIELHYLSVAVTPDQTLFRYTQLVCADESIHECSEYQRSKLAFSPAKGHCYERDDLRLPHAYPVKGAVLGSWLGEERGNLLKTKERETGIDPATSSLGIWT
jgi:hypothetical protein